MAKRKEKVQTELDNGEIINTIADGWTQEYIDENPVLVEGWGSNPHFGVSKGFLVAVGDKLPQFVLGTLRGKKVIDPIALNEDILNTYAQTKGLSIERIRIAGRKNQGKTMANALFTKGKDAMDVLKSSNPDLYKQLMAMAGIVEEETDEEVEEETDEELIED